MFGRLLSLFGLLGLCFGTAASELHFEWASPLPHRQTWVDMAVGNGKIVGITDGLGGRLIYNSKDGKTWSFINSPTNASLRQVTFDGARFVAVGDRATILTSEDGSDWTLRNTDAVGGRLLAADSGNGVTVTVGYNAEAYASSDLIHWTRLWNFGFGYSLLNVKFGNGRFVAIGQAGKLWTSTDGFQWNEIIWPQSVPAIDRSTYEAGLAFNNGVFLLSGFGGTAASADGINWTVTNSKNYNKFTVVPNAVLGLYGTTISQTPNGSIWQTLLDVQAPAGLHFTCVAQLNGMTVAGGENGLLYCSSDSLNWQRCVKEVDYSNPFVAYGNGLFVRYGTAPCVQISADGEQWQKVSGTPSLRALAFGNALWVGIDGNGTAAISSNAKTWETISLPVLAGNKIAFANGRFVADSANGILTSTDGRNWDFIAIPNAQAVLLIGNSNGRWAAVLDGSRPATSNDGVNWTVHPAQSALRGSVFAASRDRFLALGGAGMGFGFAAWSLDGITWQEQRLESGTTQMEQSLTYGDGQFLLTDSYGGVFQSSDGTNWIGSRQASQVFTSAVFGNGAWLLCGGDSILRSSTRVQNKAVIQLQLVPQSAGTWAISLRGPAGDSFSIEATAALGAAWAPVKSVTIPALGEVMIPMDATAGNRFYRAAAIQP